MRIKYNIKLITCLLLLFIAASGQAQVADVIVQGKVSSVADGELIGASVTEVDANNRIVSGSVTDINGHYVIKVKNTKKYSSGGV